MVKEDRFSFVKRGGVAEGLAGVAMPIAGDIPAEGDVLHQAGSAVDGEIGRAPLGDLFDERFKGEGSGVGHGEPWREWLVGSGQWMVKRRDGGLCPLNL